MSLSVILLAAPGEAAAIVTATPPWPDRPGVDLGPIDWLKLSDLGRCMSPGPDTTLPAAGFELLAQASDLGPWLRSLPASLLPTLAAWEPLCLEALARTWAATEAMRLDRQDEYAARRALEQMREIEKRTRLFKAIGTPRDAVLAEYLSPLEFEMARRWPEGSSLPGRLS